jgi:hypothetical protein
MGNEEDEYQKLKGLIEGLNSIGAGKHRILHDARIALEDAPNPEALGNLERSLHNARLKILSELQGIIKSFG